MTIAEKLTQIAENEQRVFEAGRNAEHNEFWNAIFSGKNWQEKFKGSSWNDNTFYPNQDIKPTGYANSLFGMCEITDLAGRLRECGVTLDTSGIAGEHRSDAMFSYATKLTTVPYLDLRNAAWSKGIMNNMFGNCYELKTIEGIHLAEDGSQNLGEDYSVFAACYALENITFYGTIGTSLRFNYCAKLSKASIENIVEHLSDTASGQTLTMSKTARRNAFTDDEWNTLIATKPNWTFSVI